VSELLDDLISHTIGGGWGLESPREGDLPVKVIRGADFPRATLKDTSNLPLRFEPQSKIRTRALREHDIILETSGGTKDRPTGRTIFITSEMVDKDIDTIPASFCRLVRVDGSKAVPAFVYYALQNLYLAGGTWEFQNQSTGISNFQFDVFRHRFRIPAFPHSAQQTIASVLSALDDKIAANTKLAVTADRLIELQFRSEVRDRTESVPLAKIADVNVQSIKPVSGGQLRYIDIASVGIGQHDLPVLTAWDVAPSRARRRVHRGDTLWSTVRPNRRSHALNLSDDTRLVASTGLAVLSPREVGFAYLYEATRQAEFVEYLESVAEGSAYPAVRAPLFESAPVPLLSRERRVAFESFAAPMREHLHSLTLENRDLSKLRDTLLPELMSGRLRVKDAEKQIEEVV